MDNFPLPVYIAFAVLIPKFMNIFSGGSLSLQGYFDIRDAFSFGFKSVHPKTKTLGFQHLRFNINLISVVFLCGNDIKRLP